MIAAMASAATVARAEAPAAGAPTTAPTTAADEPGDDETDESARPDGELSDAELLAAAEAAAASDEIIEIQGEAPELADATRRTLDATQIRRIPGAGNDALRALQALPGFARVPFSLGGLVVRGASPRDTAVFIDGVRVPQAFHFGGLTAFYPSTLLDAVEVFPSSASVSRGRVLGAVVELRARPGRTDRWRVGGELGVLDASTYADGPVGGGAITVGVRRSHFDRILTGLGLDEYRLVPSYQDSQLRFDRGLATDRAGAWSASLLWSQDTITVQERVLKVGFARAIVGWERRVGTTTVKVTPWAGLDQTSTAKDTDGVHDESSSTTVPLGLRAEVSGDHPRGLWSVGVDGEGASESHSGGEDPEDEPSPFAQPDAVANLAVWADVLIRLVDDRLTIHPGVRVDRAGRDSAWTVDPRITITQALDDRLTLRETVSVQHEVLGLRDLPPIKNDEIEGAWASHVAFGAELDLGHGTSLAATAYRIDGKQIRTPVIGLFGFDTGVFATIIEMLSANFGMADPVDDIGLYRNSGVEIDLRHRHGRVFAWLAYTWSRARRRDFDTFNPYWKPYLLDQPHVLNALASVELGAWNLGARLRFATGNPTVKYNHDPAELSPEPLRVLKIGRLPDFITLDVRVDRAWRRRWGTIAVYLDVQNATNRTNVEDVEGGSSFEHPTYIKALPIVPMIGVEVRPPT